jgi:diguanylate cyclase (GGDEF)-like protein
MDEIQRFLDEQINLPSPPAIAAQILNTVQNSESSIGDLEKIISADPALTSKMLRIANSAFYSLPNEVSNIGRALSILGTNIIKNIALSFVFAGDMRGNSTPYFNFDYFWRRSVTAAVAAELVLGLLQEKDDDIFVTAILQDIGVLIMFLSRGQEYATVLKSYVENEATSLIEAERDKYKFDHQQLGFTLLESWGIPNSITTPMRYHHEPELAPEEFQKTASVLRVANLLSAIYSGTNTAGKVSKLQIIMEDVFDISPDQTRELLDDVAAKSVDILKIFDIDPGEMKPYSLMLQEANDELGKLNLSYEQLVLELKESKGKAERFANELKEANVQLEEMAFRDGLTGLYNHRYFQEILGKEINRSNRYNHPLCLIMFDIDFFKKVNDTYGHPAGDLVLVNLSKAISNAVRPSDILARYGGEEFAVLLPETNHTGMKVFAERLRRCAAAVTTVYKNNEIRVTVSCGGAEILLDDKVSKQDLLDTADRGLYMSKENGRNCVTILPVKPSSK